MTRCTHNVRWYIRRRIFGTKIHFFHGSIGWEIQVGKHYWILKYKCCQYKTASGKRFTHHIDTFAKGFPKS